MPNRLVFVVSACGAPDPLDVLDGKPGVVGERLEAISLGRADELYGTGK